MRLKDILWLCVPLMLLTAFAGLGIAYYLLFKKWYINALIAVNISVLAMCLGLSLKTYLMKTKSLGGKIKCVK